MIKIRKALIGDRPYIEDIAKNTWEGHDYLTHIFTDWIKDGGFYAAVDGKRVIGTVKLSILPGKTVWLEGLRVHPDYQGKKIGNLLNDFIMEKAESLVKKGTGSRIAIATYFKNAQSLRIACKNGFSIKERFFCLGRVPDRIITGPASASSDSFDFNVFGEHIPYGWKFVENSEEGIDWIKAHSLFFRAGAFDFYSVVNSPEPVFMPLVFSSDAISEYTGAFNYITGNKGYYEIMIPEKADFLIPALLEKGFEFYEQPHEANVYVLVKDK